MSIAEQYSPELIQDVVPRLPEADPKDPAREVYQRRHRALHDHGTRGNSARRKDLDISAWQRPQVGAETVFAESMETDVEPSAIDWSDMGWLDDVEGPAPVLYGYDGPWSPEKDAEAARARRDANEFRATVLLDKLTQGDIDGMDAYRQYASGLSGQEKAAFDDALAEVFYDLSDEGYLPGFHEGVGRMAIAKTLDHNPLEDTDYLEGFHVITPR